MLSLGWILRFDPRFPLWLAGYRFIGAILPGIFYSAGANRKNCPGEELVNPTAMNGVPLEAVTQFGEDRLVVVCRITLPADAGQNTTD